MVPYGPPDIKFSVEIPKSPFGDIENLTKLAHDSIPPYHSAPCVEKSAIQSIVLSQALKMP